MALRTSGRRSRSLSRRVSLSKQFPKVAPQLVERGTGLPRLLQVEPGRQSRLIDRRAVVLSRDHAASLEKFLGPANRFSVWRRRRIVHDSPIAAERANGARKPGFVLGLGEYHADRNRPGAPPHSLQQRRRATCGAVVVRIRDDDHCTTPVALSELAMSERHGLLQVVTGDHSALRQSMGGKHMERVFSEHLLRKPAKQYRNGFYFSMPFDDRIDEQHRSTFSGTGRIDVTFRPAVPYSAGADAASGAPRACRVHP